MFVYVYDILSSAKYALLLTVATKKYFYVFLSYNEMSFCLFIMF